VTLETLAAAKINRELRVGPRRPDGYHAIRSRFTSIDLADRLVAEPSEGLEFSCDDETVPADAANLVVRAALLFASRLGIEPRARLRLEKSIPAGAGLGGGSADAAASLRLLSQLWSTALSEGELAAIAGELGSDVAFFLTGGDADVAGRGEQVFPREDAPRTELLLLVPPFALSTAAVYAAFDRLSPGNRSAPPDRLEIDSSGKFFGPNDLASTVLAMRPEMTSYLRSAGEVASEHAVTGSGSAVVLRGVPADAEGWLAQRHPQAKILRCRTLGREEYRHRTRTSGGSAWRSRK
jgi:4-diphosphocytidyl-2-C-methyl-D-erythritol kinase